MRRWGGRGKWATLCSLPGLVDPTGPTAHPVAGEPHEARSLHIQTDEEMAPGSFTTLMVLPKRALTSVGD